MGILPFCFHTNLTVLYHIFLEISTVFAYFFRFGTKKQVTGKVTCSFLLSIKKKQQG